MVNFLLDKQLERVLQGKRNDQEIDTGTIVELQNKSGFVGKKTQKKLKMRLKLQLAISLKDSLLKGLGSIVKFSCNAVVANTSIGEYETTDMFIIWSNNALLRCDAFYYR